MQKKFYFPYIGQRILKTAAAVFLCLAFYYLRGYSAGTISAEAPITAIICMQPYVQDTKEYALNRLAGTLIGALWGFLFLLIVPLFPGLTGLPLYALMGAGVLISLYSAVAVKKPDTSSLAAIVFICVVIVYPEVSQPLEQAFRRVLDVLVGTGIAIGVNVLRLPRTKLRDRLFFVRTKDLAPDQLSQMPAVALFRLNYLNTDGANVCLISEHAPAFFLSQLGHMRLNVPMIVMDGAGIYDTNENAYLATTNVDPAAARWLTRQFSDMGVNYFIYTVHKNRNYIYHHGSMSAQEQAVYQRMKRSPYRQYLDDDAYDPEDIVYFKVVAAEDRAERVWRQLKDVLPHNGLRCVLRPQAGIEGCASVYFYAAEADVPHAEKQVLALTEEKQPGLRPREIYAPKGYRTEHDAIHLLHRLGSAYEPLKAVYWLRRLTRRE